jgi:hypothetical protein
MAKAPDVATLKRRDVPKGETDWSYPYTKESRRLKRRDLFYLLKARLEQYHQTSMGFQARR